MNATVQINLEVSITADDGTTVNAGRFEDVMINYPEISDSIRLQVSQVLASEVMLEEVLAKDYLKRCQDAGIEISDQTVSNIEKL